MKRTSKKKKRKPPRPLVVDDPKVIIAALEKNHGIHSWAARDLGVTSMTLFNYRKRWPEVDRAYKRFRKKLLPEYVRGRTYDMVERGNPKAILFIASRVLPELRKPKEVVHKHGQDPNAAPIQHAHGVLVIDPDKLPIERRRELLALAREARGSA